MRYSFGPWARILVVSPHFDDAVLSIGGLLRSAVTDGHEVHVVTACGGKPAAAGVLSAWDARCGFRSGREAAERRAGEDLRACGILGVTATHLSGADDSYEPDAGAESVFEFLTEHAVRFSHVAFPAGIGANTGHLAVRDRALAALPDQGPQALLYADLPYAATYPGWRDALPDDAEVAPFGSTFEALRCRVGDLAGHVIGLDAESWTTKREAIHQYSSQLVTLGIDHGAFMAFPGPLQREMIWELKEPGHR